MIHQHTWTLVNRALGRYRCECGVVGHKPARGGGRIVPYECQKEIDGSRKHCAREAVHVTGQRTQSRCQEHAPEGRAA